MPTRLVIDCDTNTEVEFELTAEEIADMEARAAEYQATQIEQSTE
jgi:hypothetical protein